MATPSAPGHKYVELPVQLWYDEKIKRVTIASTDPDLPDQRFILQIKPGTAADQAARALLAKFGKPSGT